MKNTLALCALVKDITDCSFPIHTREGFRVLSWADTLDHYLPHIDQAVFAVSTQSTDGSENIIREKTADWKIPVDIYTFDWPDDCSAAFNGMLEHASTDWILRTHGDRMMFPGTVENIKPFIENHPNLQLIKLRQVPEEKVRMAFDGLFKSNLRFDGIIWEHMVKRPDYQGTIAEACVTPDETIFYNTWKVHHDDEQDERDKTKAGYRQQLNNKEIIRVRALETRARETKSKNASLWYNIGMRMLYLVKPAGRFKYQQAYEMFERAANLEPEEPAPVIRMGDCTLYRNRFPEAIALYNKAGEMGSTIAYDRARGAQQTMDHGFNF